MKGTPVVAVALISVFLVCTAAKNGDPAVIQPLRLQQKKLERPIAIQTWDVENLLESHRASKRRYTRFFRVPSTHCGIYSLPKGAQDNQRPHSEDELYYVVRGRAKMQCGKVTRDVKPGSLLFIAAGADHRFTDVQEDLELLVVFSSGPRQPKKAVKKATANASARQSGKQRDLPLEASPGNAK